MACMECRVMENSALVEALVSSDLQLYNHSQARYIHIYDYFLKFEGCDCEFELIKFVY